jgi:pentatricopeptide repeat protein
LGAGFMPNFSVYSWLIDGYCIQQNEEEALKLPDEFIKRGFSEDVFLYSSIIRGLCRKGKLRSAEKVFYKMSERGLVGDALIYTTLVYAYLGAGEQSKALELCEEMDSKRILINLKTFDVFVKYALEMDGRPEVFWNGMIERGLAVKSVAQKVKTIAQASTSSMLF